MQIAESQLAELRARHHSDKIVLTGGAFDLLHCGHLDFLEASKRFGDVLVLALANDTEPRVRKGVMRPIVAVSLRVRLLDAFKSVDYALVRSGNDFTEPMLVIARALRPDILVLCEDIPPTILARFKATLPQTEIVIDNQAKVDSTTDIIKHLRKAES